MQDLFIRHVTLQTSDQKIKRSKDQIEPSSNQMHKKSFLHSLTVETLHPQVVIVMMQFEDFLLWMQVSGFGLSTKNEYCHLSLDAHRGGLQRVTRRAHTTRWPCQTGPHDSQWRRTNQWGGHAVGALTLMLHPFWCGCAVHGNAGRVVQGRMFFDRITRFI